MKKRPRRLLIIVNPISGNKNGNKMYNNSVAGIFKQAGIETDVIGKKQLYHMMSMLLSHKNRMMTRVITHWHVDVYGESTLHTCTFLKQRWMPFS